MGGGGGDDDEEEEDDDDDDDDYAVTNAFIIMGIVIAIYAILAYNLFAAT